MSEHVIVGAGAVGTAAALLLARRGDHVRLVTRRGTGPQHRDIELIAADATSPERLTELTKGAVALYNCASPAYHQWLTDWPPLQAAFLAAAEHTGAVLATMSNPAVRHRLQRHHYGPWPAADPAGRGTARHRRPAARMRRPPR